MPNLIDLMMGNTDKQRLDRFVDKELPVMVAELERDPTGPGSVDKVRQLFGAALKAGIPPDGIKAMMAELQGPFKANMAAGEFEKIGQSLGPQTVNRVTDTPTQPQLPGVSGLLGPGLEQSDLSLPFSVEQQQTPGRAFNQGDAAKVAAISARTGINPPPGLAGLLTAPSAVMENEGQAAAAQALAERQRAEQRKLSQATTERAMMEGEAGVMARADSAPLVSYTNQERNREMERPLVQAKIGTEGARANELGTQSQYNLAGVGLRNAQVGTERAQQGELGTRSRYNTERARTEGNRRFELGTQSEANAALADLRRRTDPNIRGGGGVDANGNPIVTTTETESAINPMQQLDAIDAIAQRAIDSGDTSPANITKIAGQMGYDMTGLPQIKKKSSLFGFGPESPELRGKDQMPSLTGAFEMKKRPATKTVIREPRVPPGGPPDQRGTKPASDTKAGEVGGTNSTRLRFDAQGNLIR